MKSKITIKQFVLLLFTLFIVPAGKAQTTSWFQPILNAGWERIYMKNVGSFDLPPTMEVQQGKYKEYMDNTRRIRGYDAPQLVAQQKGLNEFEKGGVERYARVILNTQYLSESVEGIYFDIFSYTQEDISQLNALYKQQTQQDFAGTNFKIITWYPLKLEKINGMSCIHYSYMRQMGNQPFVLVHGYDFLNKDRVHILMLSYRLSETEYWKKDFEIILKSFIITNIR
ncbi:hypothetical protein FACS189438_1730 [Bacteroidia bacterium]|nr:hypothetical protein FACS189438_1730 [Bacteroidia bacterium]